MRILVYGAGVLGCNLANDLFCAGKDVTLLARGSWADTIQKTGLCIQRKFLPGVKINRIPVITELCPEDAYDMIFAAVRYTQIDFLLEVLSRNVSSTVVFAGNNVQARALAAKLPGKNVLLAFSLSAGHREKDRVVSIDLKKITIGPLSGISSQRERIEKIFAGMHYKVVYEPNMEDYLLCHAAFVLPAVFACYKTDGNLKKLKGNTAYLNRIIDANIEGYRAIRKAGHAILPEADKEFETPQYRKTCLRFYRLMCATSLGKICASDHAMNAIEEMNAMNRDIRAFFDAVGADYPVWKELEKDAAQYFQAR